MHAAGSNDLPLDQQRAAECVSPSGESGAYDDRPEPLSEAETEALAGWIPGDAIAVAILRGRPDGDTYPLWVATPRGVLAASIVGGVRGQLRARTDWVPAEVIRRVVGIRNGAAVSVLLQARTRLFTVLSDDDTGAGQFVSAVRSLLAASGRRRRARPSVAAPRSPNHEEAA